MNIDIVWLIELNAIQKTKQRFYCAFVVDSRLESQRHVSSCGVARSTSVLCRTDSIKNINSFQEQRAQSNALFLF